MTFLLTNDDGIDAPGLQALHDVALDFGPTLWVAPLDALSGCAHRVTTHMPLRIHARGEGRWAVDGTPADCVRVALHHLTPETDWILSGVNHGGNLGADVYISGTVAAVREGALHGKPGIAFSHYCKRGMTIDWPRAKGWIKRALDDLLARPLEPGAFWNVNLPHLRPEEPEPEMIVCELEGGPLPVKFRETPEGLVYAGNYHERPRQAGRDVDVCFRGDIAATLMKTRW